MVDSIGIAIMGWMVPTMVTSNSQRYVLEFGTVVTGEVVVPVT